MQSTEQLKKRILNYVTYLEDTHYLGQIITSTSLSNLQEIICELLRSPDDDIVSSTGLFIRDTILFGSSDSICQI
jgi:hypothetical protein